MPVAPNAIDNPQPIAVLMMPARPLPASPQKPESVRPQTGDVDSPRIQALYSSATARIRGVIGASATVGPNAATIGAPGILGNAIDHSRQARAAVTAAIGSRVDTFA